jgi:hypothetical protein
MGEAYRARDPKLNREVALKRAFGGHIHERTYRFLGPNRVELSVITNAEGQRLTNGQVLAWERIGR